MAVATPTSKLPSAVKSDWKEGTSKYLDHYPDVAYDFARGGLSMSEMAKKFGITERTVLNWKRTIPEFKAAIVAGQDIACSSVESALFKSALGFKEVITRDILNPDKSSGQKIVQFKTEVYHPPNQKSIEFFLTNKKPGDWSHRAEVSLSETEKKALEIAKREKELIGSGKLTPLNTNPLLS